MLFKKIQFLSKTADIMHKGCFLKKEGFCYV